MDCGCSELKRVRLIVHMKAKASNPRVEAKMLTPWSEPRLKKRRRRSTHNAAGLIKNICPAQQRHTRGTVERSRAAKQKLIIISSPSATDYVRSEKRLPLEHEPPQRPVSRMKKKLVVVATNHLPVHAQDARDTSGVLWRGMPKQTGYTAISTPIWDGSLADFLGQDAQEVHVEFYAKPPNLPKNKLHLMMRELNTRLNNAASVCIRYFGIMH
jgi:hypothetical protein